MSPSTIEQRRKLQRLSREALRELQLGKLNRLLETILPLNSFYQKKLSGFAVPISDLEDLRQAPFTTKDDLTANEKRAGVVANLTFSPSEYVRFHRTSGTRGRPLMVLDTGDDWRWWIDGWQFVLDAAQAMPEDRAMLAFSFGPFIGFWSAHDALVERGVMTVPAGGMSTLTRLELVRSAQVTLLCCTPTYALRMAEVAAENRQELRSTSVRCIIVAGEPGGSVAAVRERIENAWDARVVDHSGATEVGPWGFADPQGKGLFINESEFLPEFFSMETGQAAGEGELAELVISTLGRTGAPVLRYRTGDLVRPSWRSQESCFVFLDGGVLGRADDMMIIRGVNIFPSSVEQILRGFPEIVEYRLTAERAGEMDSLRIEIEDQLNDPQRVAQELLIQLGLKVEVTCVPLQSLPRFEAKGNRFLDQRRR